MTELGVQTVTPSVQSAVAAEHTGRRRKGFSLQDWKLLDGVKDDDIRSLSWRGFPHLAEGFCFQVQVYRTAVVSAWPPRCKKLLLVLLVQSRVTRPNLAGWDSTGMPRLCRNVASLSRFQRHAACAGLC